MTVTLSGGELGGLVVDGTGWNIGDQRIYNGLVYVLVTADLACFNGAA